MNSYTENQLNSPLKMNNPIGHSKNQQGIGIVEMLVAVFILAFGSLAIFNLQTSSLLAAASSTDHFKINEISQNIAEQLKSDSNRAASGEYNTNFEDIAAATDSTVLVANRINNWKTTVSRSMLNGQTQIVCDNTSCTVALKWVEYSHDGVSEQVFNLKTAL